MAIDVFGNSDRRRVLSLLLKNGEMTVAQILSHFNFSGPALSRHLKKLAEENLVSVKRVQNTLYYSCKEQGIQQMMQDMKDTLGDRFEFNIKKKKNSPTNEKQMKENGDGLNIQ